MLSAEEKRVLSYINEDELIRWTQDLVRIPSVYRPDQNEAEEPAAQWVMEKCRAVGLETHWEMVAPKRPNVVALFGRPGGKCLMFEGHIDVVTEGDRSAWKHDPFGAEIADGRIYGRGSNDMKGGLVAAMIAIKAIKESGVKLDGEILLAAVCDEEGHMIGIKHFVQQGWAKRVSACVVCEPEENHLCISQKGVLWVKIRTLGKMCHGAMPLTGINPMVHMAQLLVELKQLEAAEIARLDKDPFLGQPSISPTALRSPVEGAGEEQKNVIPAVCRATLDMRLIPGQTPEDMVAKIRAIFDTLKAQDPTFQAELEIVEARPPTATPKTEPVVMTLHAAVRDVAGREPVYGGVPGTTDGTILHAWAGVPIVTCGPGDIHIPHHIDEYLDIDQLVEAAKLYVVTALRYLGQSS